MVFVYDYKKTIIKALKVGILFAIPAVFNHFAALYPDFWNIPFGAVLVAAWDFLKNKWLCWGE